MLLDEISKNQDLTQRELSSNLGIALGLINSYLKNLVSKGYVTVSHIPKKRYKYFLTPKGLVERTRLTYAHLRNFTNLYRVARRDFRQLFQAVANSNVTRVGFCGVGEVAEIAYLSLKEVNLELTGVFDDLEGSSGKEVNFFGLTVAPLSEAADAGCELLVITSFQRGDELRKALKQNRVREDAICDISKGGWLKKIDARGPDGNRPDNAKGNVDDNAGDAADGE